MLLVTDNFVLHSVASVEDKNDLNLQSFFNLNLVITKIWLVHFPI